MARNKRRRGAVAELSGDALAEVDEAEQARRARRGLKAVHGNAEVRGAVGHGVEQAGAPGALAALDGDEPPFAAGEVVDGVVEHLKLGASAHERRLPALAQARRRLGLGLLQPVEHLTRRLKTRLWVFLQQLLADLVEGPGDAVVVLAGSGRLLVAVGL
jgi:hypothetical protein